MPGRWDLTALGKIYEPAGEEKTGVSCEERHFPEKVLRSLPKRRNRKRAQWKGAVITQSGCR